MKRTLSDPSNDNQPPKKRHKKNTPTPIHNDSDKARDKPQIIKSLTATSNTSAASNASSMTDDENECCICFNKIELPITLECGHVFCFLCLKEIRMQSCSTFNFANFNDKDKDANIDNNVEKFSCPYCRQEFDVKVIDKATMKKTEWMENNNNKQNKNKNNENEQSDIVIWQYSGRNGGWWAYQKGHQKQLEKGFKKFMEELKIQQEKEEKTQKQMDDGIASKYGFDDDDTDDDDLGNEVGLLCHECMIEIGVRKYVVDFAQMIQFDYENPTRTRKVTRKVETKQTLERSDSLKGCAGKFFDENRNKKDKEDEKSDKKVDE